MAWEYGVPMAMHFAGTPVGCMANVHCAAATLEFPGARESLAGRALVAAIWYRRPSTKPIVNHGWITVPDKPGLGITLNEDVVRQHLMPGTGYFEPTTEWDHERSWDRLWS